MMLSIDKSKQTMSQLKDMESIYSRKNASIGDQSVHSRSRSISFRNTTNTNSSNNRSSSNNNTNSNNNGVSNSTNNNNNRASSSRLSTSSDSHHKNSNRHLKNENDHIITKKKLLSKSNSFREPSISQNGMNRHDNISDEDEYLEKELQNWRDKLSTVM